MKYILLSTSCRHLRKIKLFDQYMISALLIMKLWILPSMYKTKRESCVCSIQCIIIFVRLPMKMSFIYSEEWFLDSNPLVEVNVLKGLVLNVFIQSVSFSIEIANYGMVCNNLENNTAIMIGNMIDITIKNISVNLCSIMASVVM